jgi:hypothetical protein
MNRFLIGGSVAFAVLLVLACGASSAAPIPKGAGANDPTPDLRVVFDTVEKAVKAKKWPAEGDEKKLKDTARAVFGRMLKAAEQKERSLPVDFEKLTERDVAAAFKSTTLSDGFIIAGDVSLTGAKKSAIFASGDVHITGAEDCVIVARNVRCTVAANCVVIAGEYIRLNSARSRQGDDPSVLLAGQWIRTTSMDGTICHVLRPSSLPAPTVGRFAGNQPEAAIMTNGAKGVVYLNDRADTRGGNPNNQTYLPQKTPIAK